jgi:Protein of unknown function (DUF2905)
MGHSSKRGGTLLHQAMGSRRPAPHSGSRGCNRRIANIRFTSWAGIIRGVGDLGKLLIGVGALLILGGVVLLLLGRAHLPLGKLPGDIIYRGKNTTFYFPLATSILLSVVLSLLLYIVSRWRR